MVGAGICTFETGKNAATRHCDWTNGGKKSLVRGTRTPSSSTGAAKGQGDKGYFMFLETSGASKQTSYQTHKVSGTHRAVSFYNHMHGKTMGSLSLDTQVGAKWRTKKSRQQQAKQTDKLKWATVRPSDCPPVLILRAHFQSSFLLISRYELQELMKCFTAHSQSSFPGLGAFYACLESLPARARCSS